MKVWKGVSLGGGRLNTREINGDFRLSPLDRLRYLTCNMRRNVAGSAKSLRTRSYYCGKFDKVKGVPSPGRFLAQQFLCEELPRLLPRSEIRILDVGCGSGGTCRLFSQAGFAGAYVGIDVEDRFSHNLEGAEGFTRRFIHGNAHDLLESKTYDLVFSNSALEHIPEDRRLIEKLDRLVAPGGLQVHIVPSGWGLALYLWHGYRQYPLSWIKELFPGHSIKVYRLGGLGCFLIHFLFITLGEIILRLNLRVRFPRVYRALFNKALILDRVFRVCPSMYIVCYPNQDFAR